MEKVLIVVDMQKDFVDGSLGTAEAVAIVDKVASRIAAFDGRIFATLDTHQADYLETAEGKKLPVPHCIKDTDGWLLNEKVMYTDYREGDIRLHEAGGRDSQAGSRRRGRGGADRALHGYLRGVQRAAAEGPFPGDGHCGGRVLLRGGDAEDP